ncbi:MAG: M56 family metallopeptidase, partial [Lachnospiraceae bacterium]|nr:M56 family metallopeptidase [Lachnospiraceae bacterium]
ILAVLVLRLFLKKAPKWLSCVLWAIVAVRLVCPVSFESAFSLIPSAETVSPEAVNYAKEPEIDSGVPVIDNVLNPIVRENFAQAPGASANPLQVWIWMASVIWAAGLTVMLGYALVSCLRIRGKVRESAPLRDNIRICDAVQSPFILGVIRPRIYLPSGMDEKQMTYVLAHERAHLRRGDHFWKPFAYMLLAVYWFHPLVWAAYLLFCRDVELACDEKAVKDMDLDGKKAYCRALLACSMPGRVMLSYPLAFGEGRVRQRVKLILHYKKPAFWVVTAAVIVCGAVAVCFLTDPRPGNDVGDGSQIRYLDQWYSKGDLSDETIEWLEWYNSLPEEEQLAVNHVPHDLYELAGYGTGSDVPVMTEDASHEEAQEGTVTFTAIIVENTMDSLTPLILVQPTGDEILYDHVCFELPAEEADWAEQINSAVIITCKDAFEETQPPYGELLSISRAEAEPDLQAMFDTFGISVRLPGNGSWIQDREYRQPDENTMEISYYDAVAKADCTLLAVKNGSPGLPETVYDASREETWGGYSGSGEYVDVRVQRSADGKQVLATWAYGEYQFAILADILWEEPGEADAGPIPKTALSVISNL